MTKDTLETVTPELVVRWFDEATKVKGEPIPSADLQKVRQIAKYVDAARKIYRVEISKHQEEELILFQEKFLEFYKKAIELSSAAQDLLNHCHPENDYDLIHRVGATLEIVDREWVNDPAPEVLTRSTWHLWAWSLRSLALDAWRAVGAKDRSPINKDNPMTRFLALALEAIDGTERTGGAIEKALHTMRKKDNEAYEHLTGDRRPTRKN